MRVQPQYKEEMKTIKIPNPVTIKNQDGSDALDQNNQPITVSFKDFVIGTLITDPKFGKTMAGIFAAVDIKKRLSNTTDTIEMDSSDWQILHEVASEPTIGYNPTVVVQLVDFLLAIKNAT